MKKELKYRSFDELLDSVKIDLPGIDIEGQIETQQLIKRALFINKQLGVKVNPRKTVLVEIDRGIGKLPYDFSSVSFAVLCTDKSSTDISDVKTTDTREDFGSLMANVVAEGIKLVYGMMGQNAMRQQNLVITISPGLNVVKHTLKTTNVVIQLRTSSGTLLTTDFTTPNDNEIHFTYDGLVPISDVQMTIIGNVQDGLGKNAVHLSLDTPNHPEVRYTDSRKQHRYKRLVPLNFVRHVKVSPDCPNLNVNGKYSVSIKDNFLHANFQDGTVYMEYVSLMEDERGRLLVLDHEFVNDYYEYQFKDTIFENMFLNGEPNLEHKMQLIAVKLDTAKTAALSFVRTPDFKEFQKTQEINRKAMYHRYYNMFI